MTNWKNIHPDLTLELQKEWEDKGFDYEEVKEWVDVGLNPNDISYARWLKHVRGGEITSEGWLEWFVNHPNKKELENEYGEYKKWVDIHEDFFSYQWEDYQSKWENLNFTLQTTELWIKLGFEPKDYGLVAYCRGKDHQCKKVNLEEVKKEYENWIKKPKSAQEYLDLICPKEKRDEITKLHISQKNLEGELNLDDFTNLKKLDCYWNQLTNLDLTNCEKLEEIDCNGNQLTNLSLPNYCPNLTTLCCLDNKLTNLNFLSVLNPEKLKALSIFNNNFSDSDLSIFSPFTNLEVLNIGNIGLSFQGERQIEQNTYNRFFGSLKPLKNLNKLRILIISNTDINSGAKYLPNSIENILFSSEERPSSKIKEMAEQLRWIGENFSVQQVKEWMELGLKPNELAFAVYLKSKDCDPKKEDLNLTEWRDKWKKISEQSQQWLDQNYPKENRSKIQEIYLSEPSLEGELDLGDFTYQNYLYSHDSVKVLISLAVDETKLSLNNLPKEVKIIKCVNAQTWLDNNYPREGSCRRENDWDNENKTRVEITRLDIEMKNLEGHLDLREFINLKKLYCCHNKLNSLNLSSCFQLEKVKCYDNQLTGLNVINCSQLVKLDCKSNLLINLILPTNSTNLRKLDLRDNDFSNQDLAFLTSYTNLEQLKVASNKFTGSLDYLSKMKRLKNLDINSTDLNEANVSNLPNNLEEVNYSTELGSNCKLTEIVPQLDTWTWKDLHSDFVDGSSWLLKRYWEKERFDKEQTKEWIKAGTAPDDYKFVGYLRDVKKFAPQDFLDNKDKKDFQNLREKCNKYDWCRQCQQPNTSEKWCQNCQEQEWQVDLNQLTGRQLIEKFIQCQQSRESDENKKLKWIPYQQFIDTSCLAKGGFSRIYKAKWGKGKYNNDKMVALKSLNDSQNITFEFLSEIANNKLFKSYNRIVEFYGISQDPKTKNYVMVMEYMESGNLRQHLQKESRDFESRLFDLVDIAEGLESIHDQGLVHWDLHSGNILVNSGGCYITDLGLSRLVNSQEKKGEIYGVLPYIAPEVLLDKPCTQASDVYSFGIIAYELFTNSYPYPKLDDMDLALIVCQGYRPNLDEVKMPPLLKDLIKQCWNADPQRRPNAGELEEIIRDWGIEIREKEDTEFKQQYQKLEVELGQSSLKSSYKIHPAATLTSKPINTKQISEKLNQFSQSVEFKSGDINKFLEAENNQDWTNLHSNFTPQLITQWQTLFFSPSQTHDWLSIGLQPSDHHFAAFLRDQKHLSPEEVLNHGNLEQLNQEFSTWQAQQFRTQQEQPPK